MIHMVLCGGHGSRLWPLSTRACPKPFCRIVDDLSMFQQTIVRNRMLCENTLIVANDKHSRLVRGQLEEIGCKTARFIWESSARNTAPAIALACLSLSPEELVLVTPSDHTLEPKILYRKSILEARKHAELNYIVTFGCHPLEPHEGYGYIQAERSDVISFLEKPSSTQAKQCLKEGNWYWNTGIYLFKAGVLLQELQRYAPDLWEACLTVYEERRCLAEKQVFFSKMEHIPEMSIDRAVMEHSERLKMVEMKADWSDLGSFEALAAHLYRHNEINTDHGCQVRMNADNNVVITSKKKVVLIDVENIIVIETDEGLLISKRGSSHKIKDIL
ncbi:sugar phosphate nucleotidyltransferase [Paenibacillus polysaccharolyticus]|uniref:mannose-1-phosphate guanylyltransferase n=1 Tax=Paenibacillus polysaccharolyticus TaxID=582692 RepID=UPI00209DD09F|nr:sugar phosphate nucleotidyltransferase [Paenibacillus polysaccharolyticus]MCP1136229.1 sugar phosphate nucleotidyltransferase [Paenibacillus polysaccharolyticus]